MQREEADRKVERFARDFVTVNKGTPVSVDRDQAQRAGRATEISPVGRGRGSCGGGREVTIRGRGGGRIRLVENGSRRWLSGCSRKFGGSFGAAAARSRTLFDAGI